MRSVVLMESLESRELMAASLVDGMLKVIGTPNRDVITLRQAGARQIVEFNGVQRSYARSAITSIRVEGRAGNDRIAIKPANAPNVEVYGGAGSDVVTGAVDLTNVPAPVAELVVPRTRQPAPLIPTVFNATSYGAIGDGVTNDAPAIQAAIDAAPAGTTVTLPAGTYRLTTALNINKPLTIEGNGATLLTDTASLPDNMAIRVMSRLSDAVHTTGAVTQGQSTFTLDDASDLAVGDSVLLRFGQDPFDPGMHHFGSLAKVLARNGNAVTLDVAVPYAINAGANPNKIIRVQSLAENVNIRNLNFEHTNQVNVGEIWAEAARNLTVENVGGRFITLLTSADSSNVTLRNVQGVIDYTHPASGRLLTAWQSDNVVVENARLQTSYDTPVVFVESHNRGLRVNGLEVQWDYAQRTTHDVIHVGGGSKANTFDNVVVRNAGAIELIQTGGQIAEYSLGKVEVTGPAVAIPVHAIADLTWRGVRYAATRRETIVLSLEAWNGDKWHWLPTGAVKQGSATISDTTGIVWADLVNHLGQGINLVTVAEAGQELALPGMMGDVYGPNDYDTSRLMRINTGEVNPDATITLEIEYYVQP